MHLSLPNRLLPERLRRILRRLLRPHHIEERDIFQEYLSDRRGPEHVMVDVGAHFGTSLEPFSKKGFRVFAFEPDPNNRRVLLQAISGQDNVIVDDRAVAGSDDEEVAFFTSPVSTGISGLSAFHASHQETARVKTVRLSTFCCDRGIDRIDLLKIDTEGFDLFVLQSLDWDSVRPELILCEFEDRKTKPLGYTLDDLCRFLDERGYALLISEWHPIVEYGRRHRHRRFLTDPARVPVDRAWGNVLAFPPSESDRIVSIARKLAHVDPPGD